MDRQLITAQVCKKAGDLLALLKKQATHEVAMPDASVSAYRAFTGCIDITLSLCANETLSVEGCRQVEGFLGDVAIAVENGSLFPLALKAWRDEFMNRITGIGCEFAAITESTCIEPSVPTTLH